MEPNEVGNWSLPRFSWDYERLDEPEHWFLMARAYLDCSHHLLGEMIQDRLSSTFHHAKVAVWTSEHAIELFLKGAIARAGCPIPGHHNTVALLAEYRNLYPGMEFEFQARVDEAVSDSRKTPRNQYARYPQDKTGQAWAGHTHIDLSIWYRDVGRFKIDFDRLVPLIKSHQPNRSGA